MSRAQTLAFFERYRDAFCRLDGDAVAELWHTPSAIADSRSGCGRVTTWTTEAPMRENWHALCCVYRELGLARCDFELRDHMSFGADHVVAKLNWSLWRSDGSLLQRFDTGYQLLRTAAGWRVFGCIAHEEDITEMKRDAEG
jgi:hypothetical protein